MIMRFVCEIGDDEHLVDAETPEDAAYEVARVQARQDKRVAGTEVRYVVTVAEANEADMPLIAGDDYTVTITA